MNDSRALNRQKGREGQDTTASMPDPAMTAEVAAIHPAMGRPDARAEAFRALVGGSLDAAYRRAALLLGDRFEAEDAVHDAAERAWRSWGSLRDAANFEAWFARILVNVCRDRMRRRRRVAAIEVVQPAPPAEDATGQRHVERAGDRAVVLDALALLSPDERTTIVLRYEADLTVPEIARLTGAREGTVKSRLHHALLKMRAGLDPEEGLT